MKHWKRCDVLLFQDQDNRCCKLANWTRRFAFSLRNIDAKLIRLKSLSLETPNAQKDSLAKLEIEIKEVKKNLQC